MMTLHAKCTFLAMWVLASIAIKSHMRCYIAEKAVATVKRVQICSRFNALCFLFMDYHNNKVLGNKSWKQVLQLGNLFCLMLSH